MTIKVMDYLDNFCGYRSDADSLAKRIYEDYPNEDPTKFTFDFTGIKTLGPGFADSFLSYFEDSSCFAPNVIGLSGVKKEILKEAGETRRSVHFE